MIKRDKMFKLLLHGGMNGCHTHEEFGMSAFKRYDLK